MKVYRGKLNNWQVHKLTLDRADVIKLYPELTDIKDFIIITGGITGDPTGKRFNNDHCRTSFVIKLDRDNHKLETLNSIYDLGKEGNDVVPEMGNNVLKLFY